MVSAGVEKMCVLSYVHDQKSSQEDQHSSTETFPCTTPVEKAETLGAEDAARSVEDGMRPELVSLSVVVEFAIPSPEATKSPTPFPEASVPSGSTARARDAFILARVSVATDSVGTQHASSR